MKTVKADKKEFRICEVEGKSYVLGNDIGSYIGYTRPSDVISRELQGNYILSHVKLPGQKRSYKRQLLPTEGVKALLEHTQLKVSNDKLSFIHNVLIPELERGRDRKLECLENKIKVLKQDNEKLKKLNKSIEIEKIRVEAEKEEVDLEMLKIQSQLKHSTTHNEILQSQLRYDNDCVLCKIKKKLRRS